jgi:hypothetical protein
MIITERVEDRKIDEKKKRESPSSLMSYHRHVLLHREKLDSFCREF